MTTDVDSGDATTLSPDEAFAVLGDETRLEILQVLGAADGQLSYSELFERIEYDDTANFSYHLRKLVDHFVRKTDEGYDLLEAGRRVVEAVLAGAVTENPVLAPTPTDVPCPFCGAAIEVGFQHARVELSCAECPGLLRFADSGGRRFTEYGSLGFFFFPPAGVYGRTATEVLEAAWTWQHVGFLTDSTGVCSRCSAPLEFSVDVCEEHDSTEGYCDRCSRRYAIRFDGHCTHCNYDFKSIAPGCLLAETELLAFLTDLGINPLAPEPLDEALDALGNYDEEVLSTDPFEATFTFVAGDEALTLTVDDDLSVTDSKRHRASESV